MSHLLEVPCCQHLCDWFLLSQQQQGNINIKVACILICCTVMFHLSFRSLFFMPTAYWLLCDFVCFTFWVYYPDISPGVFNQYISNEFYQEDLKKTKCVYAFSTATIKFCSESILIPFCHPLSSENSTEHVCFFSPCASSCVTDGLFLVRCKCRLSEIMHCVTTAKNTGQVFGHLDFKIVVEPSDAPAFTVVLLAPSRQEKAAWTSDISQVSHPCQSLSPTQRMGHGSHEFNPAKSL